MIEGCHLRSREDGNDLLNKSTINFLQTTETLKNPQDQEKQTTLYNLLTNEVANLNSNAKGSREVSRL
ncbi:hypothetical protein [Legionella massiliensis]|uniref:hypothetical protein n=1 Tax=Legionella massiliensis TaxID=1034943 RepID=UPI0005C3A001|nr:hypothetical protein [Legionella massiliensis]